VKELESPTTNDEEVTFAKQELGDEKAQTKLLGLSWDKSISFPEPAILGKETKALG
jgi:hypothetical protein